jgi:hypothetical protein
MSYGTASGVHRLNTNRTFTATSRPTITEVDGFLANTAAEIDGILRQRGYTLPVPTTASSALVLLAHGNELGAAAMVEQGAQKSDRLDSALSLWRDFKRLLQSANLELDVATTDAKLPRYSSSATAAFTFPALDSFGDPTIDT